MTSLRTLFPSSCMAVLLGAVLLAQPSFATQGEQALAKSKVAAPPATTGENSSTRDRKSSGKVTSAHSSPTAASADVAAESYQLGVEDELQISVWREPDLSIPSVVVRPDGMITIPLLNDINVVGLTTRALQNLLTDKLKAFVNDPQVTVIVRSIRSRRVYLMGEVGHPGTYPLNGKKTVLQLLAEAGGIGPFAKPDSTYVLRQVNGKKERIAIHYRKAIVGNSPDPELLPGDIVVVP